MPAIWSPGQYQFSPGTTNLDSCREPYVPPPKSSDPTFVNQTFLIGMCGNARGKNVQFRVLREDNSQYGNSSSGAVLCRDIGARCFKPGAVHHANPRFDWPERWRRRELRTRHSVPDQPPVRVRCQGRIQRCVQKPGEAAGMATMIEKYEFLSDSEEVAQNLLSIPRPH